MGTTLRAGFGVGASNAALTAPLGANDVKARATNNKCNH